MRLFLASQDLGNYAEVLRQMVGTERRALVISNARDYYGDETCIAVPVKKALANLSKIGIEAERLDLRPYFGKQQKLLELIERKQVGLIFSIGGSVICLATAMHESGIDEIIKQGVFKDKFVYGGYSAGSMVAGNDLSLYQLDVKPGEEAPLHRVVDITYRLYDLAPYKHGLELIPQYIVPHIDRADHVDVMSERVAKIEQAGVETICLDDSDVFIVDGDNIQVMKAGK